MKQPVAMKIRNFSFQLETLVQPFLKLKKQKWFALAALSLLIVLNGHERVAKKPACGADYLKMKDVRLSVELLVIGPVELKIQILLKI